jgi:hypothetical protein
MVEIVCETPHEVNLSFNGLIGYVRVLLDARRLSNISIGPAKRIDAYATKIMPTLEDLDAMATAPCDQWLSDRSWTD